MIYFSFLVRPQGWANLGKINSRRVPPPANVPSLKSETGVNTPTFDPTVTPNHGWTSNDNSATSNSPSNPTQQQLDSLPVSSPTPPSSADIDKSRVPPTWSTITAGANASPNESTAPSLLALNDFPRLATTQDRKSQSESMTNAPNPTFRPANLATWKEGGGTRVPPPLSNDIPQMMPTHPGANFYPQANMRMCPPEMVSLLIECQSHIIIFSFSSGIIIHIHQYLYQYIIIIITPTPTTTNNINDVLILL